MNLSDIAKLANVSKATASRAMANSPLVKDSTRELVQDIARKYDYKPNTLARAVAKKRSGILGFCILKRERPFFGHTFYGPVLDGIVAQAKQDAYHIILAANNSSDPTFDEAFIQDSIEGVILASLSPLEVVNEFKKRGIPQVLLNDVLDTENNTFIMDDNYNGAYALMKHLIEERGHRQIAFLSDRLSHTDYLLRYLAYIDAHTAFGLKPFTNDALPKTDILGGIPLPGNHYLKERGWTEINIVGTPMIVPNLKPESGYAAVKTMLATGKLPTAIFAATDTLAVGAIHALQDSGLRVPQDIAVAGYDDVDIATAVSPALTTVRTDLHAIGRAAVKELEKLIANPQKESEIVYVKNELMIREST